MVYLKHDIYWRYTILVGNPQFVEICNYVEICNQYRYLWLSSITFSVCCQLFIFLWAAFSSCGTCACCIAQSFGSADSLAKKGTAKEQVDRSTSYPEVKTILKAKQHSKWRHEHPQYNKADPYYLLTRREQVTVFRFRTGHNCLSYHLYSKLRIGHTKQCPCGTGSQTTEHLLQSCPIYEPLRKGIWPDHTPIVASSVQVWGTCNALPPSLRRLEFASNKREDLGLWDRHWSQVGHEVPKVAQSVEPWNITHYRTSVLLCLFSERSGCLQRSCVLIVDLVNKIESVTIVDLMNKIRVFSSFMHTYCSYRGHSQPPPTCLSSLLPLQQLYCFFLSYLIYPVVWLTVGAPL